MVRMGLQADHIPSSEAKSLQTFLPIVTNVLMMLSSNLGPWNYDTHCVFAVRP